MNQNDPVVLQTANNLADAEIVKNALEEKGIRCELDGDNQGSFTGLLAVRILVRAGDEERARKVIGSHIHHHAHSGPHKRG